MAKSCPLPRAAHPSWIDQQLTPAAMELQDSVPARMPGRRPPVPHVKLLGTFVLYWSTKALANGSLRTSVVLIPLATLRVLLLNFAYNVTFDCNRLLLSVLYGISCKQSNQKATCWLQVFFPNSIIVNLRNIPIIPEQQLYLIYKHVYDHLWERLPMGCCRMTATRVWLMGGAQCPLSLFLIKQSKAYLWRAHRILKASWHVAALSILQTMACWEGGEIQQNSKGGRTKKKPMSIARELELRQLCPRSFGSSMVVLSLSRYCEALMRV